jgi:hypothetical protein
MLLILVIGGVVAYKNYTTNSLQPLGEAIFTVKSATGTPLVTVTAGGRVGIGTEHPATSLEVAGPIRLTKKSSEGCSEQTAGMIAYNPDNRRFWGCNGYEWRALDNN